VLQRVTKCSPYLLLLRLRRGGERRRSSRPPPRLFCMEGSGSPYDVRECYRGVTGVLQEFCVSVTRVLRESYKSVIKVLQGSYTRVTRVLQECYKSETTMLQECYKSATRVLRVLQEFNRSANMDTYPCSDPVWIRAAPWSCCSPRVYAAQRIAPRSFFPLHQLPRLCCQK
jgi:hypothetical protein